MGLFLFLWSLKKGRLKVFLDIRGGLDIYYYRKRKDGYHSTSKSENDEKLTKPS